MPIFDKDVFELMIEKVIIGEKDNKEKTNPRVITFILKSGNEIKCEEEKSQQSSYEANQNYLQKVCEPCGMRGSDVKGWRQYTIIGDGMKKRKNFETIEEYLLWVYANLSMAHAALKSHHETYDRLDYMIRAKLYKGFCSGTHHIRSLYDDEKSKLTNPVCCYCGTQTNLSLDHLISKYNGGNDSGDNIVYACKTCNSSKNKQDVIVWYLKNEKFPPILVLRRYLKLEYNYFEQNDYLRKPYCEFEACCDIFRIDLLPYKFPQPSSLKL